MDNLVWIPIGIEWELSLFIGLIYSYLTYDYINQIKPKRSKRAERQIFDEPLEVSRMMARVVANQSFAKLRIKDQQKIIELINNRYK